MTDLLTKYPPILEVFIPDLDEARIEEMHGFLSKTFSEYKVLLLTDWEKIGGQYTSSDERSASIKIHSVLSEFKHDDLPEIERKIKAYEEKYLSHGN